VNVPEILSTAITESARLYALHEAHELPAHAGIYVVFDDVVILYVGRAENIRRRWGSHHRMAQLSQNPNAHIVIIERSLPELVKAERYYINLLHPTLNRTPVGASQRQRRAHPWPPKRRRRAKPWPAEANHIADATAADSEKISTKADKIDWQSDLIDRWADLGAEALKTGNMFEAQQMFLNIRHATATQRHVAADIKTTAGDARTALAAARRGEY